MSLGDEFPDGTGCECRSGREGEQALYLAVLLEGVGALGRFDRCFFGDLASLWRARA